MPTRSKTRRTRASRKRTVAYGNAYTGPWAGWAGAAAGAYGGGELDL